MALKKKVQTVQKIVKKAAATPAQSAALKRGDYIHSVGRRKTSIARVRMYRGSGEHMVNDKPLAVFFKDWIYRSTALEPLFATGTDKAVYFTAKVVGGGIHGQATAISHAIARALVKLSEDHKPTLRAKELLTRDSRMRETRKIGTGGKARRAKQSPKR